MVNKKKGNKGFTLIELMIVIAIIAILAAILVPNFLKARSQGQLTACQSNLKNVGTALEMYSTDNSGLYPATGESNMKTKLETDYLKQVPMCPAVAGQTAYKYEATAVWNMFTLSCVSTGDPHKKARGACVSGYPQYTASGGLNTP